MENSSIRYDKILKKIRKDRKLSQEELATMVNVRKSTISNYETSYSKPSLEMLEKLASALDISLTEFINYDKALENDDHLHFPRALQPTSECYIPFFTLNSLKKGFYKVPNFMDYYLSLPGFMLGDESAGYMCIKMPDNAMDDGGPKKNDFLIIRKTNDISKIPNKSIVLAQKKDSEDILIRTYFRDGHIIALIPSSISGSYTVVRTDERNREYDIIGCVEKILTNSPQL